jgi:hypothetical protein
MEYSGVQMMQRTGNGKLAKQRLVVVPAVLLVIGSSCGGCLSRPTPSKQRYLAMYMEHFDVEQIESIDYTYEGAIGGATTAARVQFNGPVTIPEGLEVIEYQPPEADDRSPDAKQTRYDMQVECRYHCGGTIPNWFDFPFDRPMRLIRESEEEATESTPCYCNEWYIDDLKNVVYFFGSWG